MIILQISELALNVLLWLAAGHLAIFLYDRVKDRVNG
tara:strand:- start:535 stop:645 length:111 start_codon:yes stop_codon:yes gene_type:complete